MLYLFVFFFKNAKWFLILLTILCESDLEILEGEVRKELANEKNHGCFIKEDNDVNFISFSSAQLVLHKSPNLK
jgi:hypothetical protein